MLNIEQVAKVAALRVEELSVKVVEGARSATVSGKGDGVPYTEYALSFDPEDWRDAVISLNRCLEQAVEVAKNKKAEGEAMRGLRETSQIMAAWRYGTGTPVRVEADFDSDRWFITTRVAFWRAHGEVPY